MTREDLKRMVYRHMAELALEDSEWFEATMLLGEQFGVLNFCAYGERGAKILAHVDDEIMMAFSSNGPEISVLAGEDAAFNLCGTRGKDQVIRSRGRVVLVWSLGSWSVRGPWVKPIEDAMTRLIQEISEAIIHGDDPNYSEKEAKTMGLAVAAVDYWLKKTGRSE